MICGYLSLIEINYIQTISIRWIYIVSYNLGHIWFPSMVCNKGYIVTLFSSRVRRTKSVVKTDTCGDLRKKLLSFQVWDNYARPVFVDNHLKSIFLKRLSRKYAFQCQNDPNSSMKNGSIYRVQNHLILSVWSNTWLPFDNFVKKPFLCQSRFCLDILGELFSFQQLIQSF